jgi:hypothetical protein
VQGFDLVEVQAQGFEKGIGEHGDAIILAFAVTDDDLVVGEIKVFDTQTQHFHTCTCATLRRKCRCEAQAAAIQKLGHETVDSLHVLNHFFCFLF